MADEDLWTRLLALARPAPAVHRLLADLRHAGARLVLDGSTLTLVAETLPAGLWLAPYSGALLALLAEVVEGGS